MKKMSLQLQIVDTKEQFAYNVLNAICSHINPRVFTKISKLNAEISKKIKLILESSEGYHLLMNNSSVIGDFGFPQGDAKPYLDAIIEMICKNINVTFSPFIVEKNRIRGSIKVGAIISDFSDILSLPEAYISYYSRLFQGMVDLDWLSWLLEKGNKIIIRDFHVEYGSHGRSGEALMRLGGSWRVDPIISGTKRNNWITRAIANDTTRVEQELSLAFEEFFNRIV